MIIQKKFKSNNNDKSKYVYYQTEFSEEDNEAIES